MIKIPKQLQNIDFRFYLIGKGTKLPIEKKWNSVNNYPYFHSKLLNHLKAGCNYGVCAGYANLIIIDFDSYDFYEKVRAKLPYTFTTVSATKRYPHYYYYLKGKVQKDSSNLSSPSDSTNHLMIKKIGINDEKGNRLCDIQANRCGIVAPNSIVDRSFYEVHNDIPIAEITLERLKAIFPQIENRIKKPIEWKGENKIDNESVANTIKILQHIEIKQTGTNNFKCPFHPSNNSKSLIILPNGRLWCFHCETLWYDIQKFVDELVDYRETR